MIYCNKKHVKVIRLNNLYLTHHFQGFWLFEYAR